MGSTFPAGKYTSGVEIREQEKRLVQNSVLAFFVVCRGKAEAEKRAVVQNPIEELDLAADTIARITEVSLDFVKEVRATLNK